MNQAEETAAFAGGTHGDSIDPAHDWEVTLSPAFGIGPDGLVEVPGRNVVMTGGRAIDVVGSRWHPVQNREVLSIARGVALSAGGNVTRSGETGSGRRFWAKVDIGSSMCVVVTSAHTGSGGLTVTPYVEEAGALVRVGLKPGLSWPHGPTLEARIAGSEDIAGFISDWKSKVTSSKAAMQKTQLPPAAFVQACSGLFLAKNRTKKREENRKDVLDTLAGKWSAASDGRLDAWSSLVTVCRWLDAERPGPDADRAEVTLDEGSWVVRAKAEAWVWSASVMPADPR